jgi:hypothetical protein
MARGEAIALSPPRIAPVSRLRNKARFKERLEQVFEAFKGRASPSGPPAFIGAEFRDPLEHTTRRYLIDEMLAGLGWNLSRLTREMVEEARVQDDTTLFLDYLGVNPNNRAPLLIVEAKAWAKPFVTPSEGASAKLGAKNSPSSWEALIAAAVEHCKAGGEPHASPVILEWVGWIHKLHQYVRAVHEQSGHKVKRVAITAGRWAIVFADPFATFVENSAVSTTTIHAFLDHEVVERSDEIYDYLAQDILVDDPPEFLQPTQLSAYIAGVDAIALFRALWIARRRDGAYFDSFPQINLYPAVIVQRRDGKLIPVVDPRRGRIPMSHRYEDISQHVAIIAQASDFLLRAVNDELGTAFGASALTSFQGFPVATMLNASAVVAAASPIFIKASATANDFLLATGTSSHYLLPQPTLPLCSGHSWTDCHTLREHEPAAPIVVRSFEPASFFTTTEPHHCAHRQVHHRRDPRCHILAFEEFLCCRACTFQQNCWTPAELGRLPCGVVVANADAAVALQASPAAH